MTYPLFAVGHSTHPIEKFLEILTSHGVKTLADVRTVPRSSFNPQYDARSLQKSLSRAGIEYVHLKELGGLRQPRPDSPNTGWKNKSFRGYADHMLTPEFEKGLKELVALAAKGPAAFMCAEGNPFRCHRSLLADALLVRGFEVCHASGPSSSKPHSLTSFAKKTTDGVVYPATDLLI